MKTIRILAICLLLSACVSHKEVTYFNDISDSAQGQFAFQEAPQLVIRSGEILEINISSISRESNSYFQKADSESSSKYGNSSFKVSLSGNVDIPLIGEIQVAGKTTEEAEQIIKEKLLAYLQKPSVNVRLASFSITMLGEVKAPGLYDIPDARVTFLEALGLAGDLTLFGRRDNVLLIRGEGADKRYYHIDLNSTSFLSSPVFYLQNHDVIYVEPSRGITSKDDNAYRIVPLLLSSLTFIAVIIGLSQ